MPKGVVCQLKYWLYGFRPAAAAWEKLYSSKLEEVGFERELSRGVVFYHRSRDLSLAVHSDDFTFCGLQEDLDWIRDLMRSWFKVKITGVLGGDPEDLKEISLLGRIVRWGRDSYRIRGGSKTPKDGD